MKPFDGEIKALTGKIKHYLSYNEYKTDANRINYKTALSTEFKKVSSFPLSEISASVWDEMNDLAEQALIN